MIVSRISLGMGGHVDQPVEPTDGVEAVPPEGAACMEGPIPPGPGFHRVLVSTITCRYEDSKRLSAFVRRRLYASSAKITRKAPMARVPIW